MTLILDNVADIAGDYDAWLCDIWGVIHNGVDVYTPACDALLRFRESGGVVVLLSNSPRPREGVREQMAGLGVPAEIADWVITSGDVTRGLITASGANKIFHTGPERDRSVFHGLDISLGEVVEAEMVVCTGLFDDDTEVPDDYAGLLGDFLDMDLPMICANPDIMVERGNKLIYCAGAIAGLYEQLGGKVEYAGKPHLPVYEMAFSVINEAAGRDVPKARVLAIGDGLKTDMLGASAAGADALFIVSSLHVSPGQPVTAEYFEHLFTKHDLMPPRAIQTCLQW
jgi:HAD superfamily hydrolase (TIGR01459 family)